MLTKRIDSIAFYTFDSYKYYPYAENPDNFITIDKAKESAKINNTYTGYYQFVLPVYFTPNTSDSPRLGYVLVDSKSEIDDWSATVYAAYFQANWHHIAMPSPQYTYNSNNSTITKCEFVMNDSAMQVTDTIYFRTYDNWTLTSANEDMIKPSVTSGKAGINKVPCTVANNLTTDTIRTSVVLKTDNGAKTTIQFKQAPKKEDKEEKKE